jgi:hypothetical protein
MQIEGVPKSKNVVVESAMSLMSRVRARKQEVRFDVGLVLESNQVVTVLCFVCRLIMITGLCT